MERADRVLPQQRHQRQSLVRRKWHQYRQLLQMAKETVLSHGTKCTAVCRGVCCTGSQNLDYRAHGGHFSGHSFGCRGRDNSHAAADSAILFNQRSSSFHQPFSASVQTAKSASFALQRPHIPRIPLRSPYRRPCGERCF